MSNNFILPSKVGTYLRRLDLDYSSTERCLHREIIREGRWYVKAGVDFDSIDGGTYGHHVTIFLSEETMGKIAFSRQRDVCSDIRADLNACAEKVANEYFCSVTVELFDETDPDFLAAIAFSRRPPLNPDALSIWKPGNIRVFVSHRDRHKASASLLATALAQYGVSCFVAHDSIEAMTSWPDEILKALRTMEFLLAFVTDDFHESIWTNQEVGFAIGKEIPVVPLKLEIAAPSGVLQSLQAIKGRLSNASDSAPEVYAALSEKLGQRERLQGPLINAFLESSSFTDAMDRLAMLQKVVTKLDEAELERIKTGYKINDQLHGCAGIHHRGLESFLSRCSGKKVTARNRQLVVE
ncbi:MAG: toll/interleukin-1 receptor domain-containing protein [Hyphomonadaceae bacterium]|nr:MAG: Uncharacterized protein FD160_1494 [Caulobacteraceae bacterium]MBT9447237.1 toll/interleukin-1 receptor domain-containing protein [Hyphomonadaceae bacterium]